MHVLKTQMVSANHSRLCASKSWTLEKSIFHALGIFAVYSLHIGDQLPFKLSALATCRGILIWCLIVYMTKLMQSDWLRGVQLFHYLHSPGVQLMIFVMAGGAGNQNNKIQYGGEILISIYNKCGRI